MLQEILSRRSIRKYKSEDVPRKVIEEILQAGILAPSSKNRQPWKFVVVTGDAKTQMLDIMERGLRREKTDPMLPESAKYLSGAEHTLAVMKSAPVIIFIINELAIKLDVPLSVDERVYEICNLQSIGAAIENMILEAAEKGLGSLWIGDIFFAHKELCDWLMTGGELCAALAVGYPDEAPHTRARKKMEEVVEWRD